MNGALLVLVGVVTGASIASLLLLSRQQPDMPPPAAVTAEPAAMPAPPRSDRPAADLTPVLARLDEIAERLQRVETGLETARAAPLREAAVASRPAVDVETLMEALAGVERRQLEALPDEALRQRAWRAMKSDEDAHAAVAGLEVLLQRQLTPQQRAEVMLDLGVLQRRQGGQDGLAASAKTLQAVIDAQGPDSKLGLGAASQLAWTVDAQGDRARALAIAESVVRSPAATADQRRNGRWAVAILAERAGDRDRARAELTVLLRELEALPEQAKFAADVRARLAKL